MPQTKDYGKLTEDQFRRLIGALPEARRRKGAMQHALKAASKDTLSRLLTGGVYWSAVYELGFLESIAWLMLALGQDEKLAALARDADPQEAALRELESDEEPDWGGGKWGVFTTGDVIGLATALQRNVLSVMVYGRSLCALVEAAREQDDDDALFDAIRLDRSVVCSPTGAARISKAELLDEKHFFLRLRRALKGPSRKHWEGLRDLRYSLFVLRELGFDRLTDNQLEHLLVKTLKVYPDTPTARKNLRQQYHQSRKLKSL